MLLDYARPAPPGAAGAQPGDTLAHALVRAELLDSCRAVEALVDGWRAPGALAALRAEEMAEVVAPAPLPRPGRGPVQRPFPLLGER